MKFTDTEMLDWVGSNATEIATEGEGEREVQSLLYWSDAEQDQHMVKAPTFREAVRKAMLREAALAQVDQQLSNDADREMGLPEGEEWGSK